MTIKSSIVTSNQSGVHKDLESSIKKHLTNPYRKPYRPFTGEIFHQLDAIQKQVNKPIILDSGCGTGESSLQLAKLNPDALVIGIDKSEKRLERLITEHSVHHQDNLVLARADVVDIWRMIKEGDWNIKKHYLLYPNPWPKKDQLKRRWHGHPVFPEMVSLCDQIELRTNWQIYAEEFKQALEIIMNKEVLMDSVEVTNFISPFEKKYYDSGHELYRVINFN
jgi:tRNA (guanine-N7-)-methyltransferase